MGAGLRCEAWPFLCADWLALIPKKASQNEEKSQVPSNETTVSPY